MSEGYDALSSFIEANAPCILIDIEENSREGIMSIADIDVMGITNIKFSEEYVFATFHAENHGFFEIKPESIVEHCCFCGKPLFAIGNNPYPVVKDENASCCSFCNTRYVVPAREGKPPLEEKEVMRLLAEIQAARIQVAAAFEDK